MVVIVTTILLIRQDVAVTREELSPRFGDQGRVPQERNWIDGFRKAGESRSPARETLRRREAFCGSKAHGTSRGSTSSVIPFGLAQWQSVGHRNRMLQVRILYPFDKENQAKDFLR